MEKDKVECRDTTHNERLFSLTGKYILSFTAWILGGIYVKWNKPGTERHMLQALTHMWNLKNLNS